MLQRAGRGLQPAVSLRKLVCVRFKRHSDSPLKKKVRRGFRGYPIATIAFYGPDNKRASKVAVAILNTQDAEPAALERWFAEEDDVRTDPAVGAEILRFVQDHRAKSVVMTDRIIGCPHEEGSIIRKDRPARSAHSGRTATAGVATPSNR
jgi:hypothetical protein